MSIWSARSDRRIGSPRCSSASDVPDIRVTRHSRRDECFRRPETIWSNARRSFASIRQGELDAILCHDAPLDVLAQQIVAETACGEYHEDELFALVRRAWPYRALSRTDFDAVLRMVAEGFDTRRGRRAALVHRDEIHHVRQRPARCATARADLRRRDPRSGRLSCRPRSREHVHRHGERGLRDREHGRRRLSAGQLFVARRCRCRPGTVRVADAKGIPPNIPFWFGEAPARSDELSRAVSDLRAAIDAHLGSSSEQRRPMARPARQDWLPGAVDQVIDYFAEGRRALGVIPTQETLVLERFFDESGGMQLVLHAPFGSRINKAWGLALRKRFCRQFNFELQAAATEDARPAVARPATFVSAGRRVPLSASEHDARRAGTGVPRCAGVPDAVALEHDHLARGSAQPRRQEGAAATAADAGRRLCWRRRFPTRRPASRTFRATGKSRIIRWSPRRCATASRRPWTSTGSRASSSASIAARSRWSRATRRSRRSSRTRF